MSSTIFYQELCIRIPAEHAGSPEDLFVHVGQAGASNCFETGYGGRCGRRSRSWQAMTFGTAAEILREGIKTAGDTEGGGLKIGGATRYSTPEQYIRKVRSMLTAAKETDIRQYVYFKEGYVTVSIEFRENVVIGEPSRVTSYDIRDPESFQAFYQRYLTENGPGQRGWNYFKVSGPEFR